MRRADLVVLLLSVFAQPAVSAETSLVADAVWLSVGGEQRAAVQLARLEIQKRPPPMLGVGWQARWFAAAVWLRVRVSEAELKQRLVDSLYFGRGAHGIEAASRAYFGRSRDALTVGETALLAGIVTAPSAHDPVCQPERALNRQRYVLTELFASRRIIAAQYLAALSEPVRLLPLTCSGR